ncbi:MAG: capsular biosynthesis protein, partial [Gordonia sp. (in: high G+C Gram-positive bacteria)]|nr:capsular biosynthesis protein [Gordonia sp. (in: high G+C Gram-positive bacteria)]
IRTENSTDAPKLALAVAQALTGLVDKLEAPQAGGPGALRLQIVDPSTQGAVRDPLVDPVVGGAGAVLGAIVGVLAALALQRRRRSAAESRAAEDTENRPTAGEATASSTPDGTADTEQFPVVTPPTASTARHHRRDGT